MKVIFIIFTVFIFNSEKRMEKIYFHLNNKGNEIVEKYKKKFPFKEPYYLKVEIVSKNNLRIPQWASGVYYNRTILLKEDKFENLLKTFAHEIAHSFFNESISHQKVPLWFEEGVAQIISGEEEDIISSFLLNLTGGLAIKDLEISFPSDIFGKRIAYAKSRVFVLKIIDRIGWDGLYVLLYNISRGDSFDEALFKEMGENINSLEKNFKKERIYKIFFIFGTGSLFFWFALSILLLTAYIMKRKKNKEVVKSWEENDTDLPYF